MYHANNILSSGKLNCLEPETFATRRAAVKWLNANSTGTWTHSCNDKELDRTALRLEFPNGSWRIYLVEKVPA